MSRLIPDSECVQGKCACCTTGCRDVCQLRAHPLIIANGAQAVAVVQAASPVQGAASATTDQGAAVKPWEERCGITRKPEGQVERAMSAEIAELRAALAERAQAAQPTPDLAEAIKAIKPENEPRMEMPCYWYRVGFRDARTAAATLAITSAIATPAPEQEAAPAEDDPVALWAEIHRLRAEAEGPKGYATWKDAAIAERLRRVQAEQAVAPEVDRSATTEYAARLLERTFFGQPNWPRVREVTAAIRGLAAPVEQEAAQVGAKADDQSHVMRPFGAPASQHRAPGGALYDALMRCCLELPAGCEVRVCVERDSGWVEFSLGDGETHHVDGEGFLSDDVVEALEVVRAEAASPPVPRVGGITNDEPAASHKYEARATGGKWFPLFVRDDAEAKEWADDHEGFEVRATATNTNQPEGEKGGAA